MRNVTERQTARASGADCAQQEPGRNLRRAEGFTLAELLVLAAIGAVLAGLALADLSQERSKLLQEACANNLKQ